MNKYIVKLVFHIVTESGNNQSQFDEQYRMVEAHSMEDAFHKARYVGQGEEDSFLDIHKNKVNWNFVDVAEVYPLNDFADGEQIFSTTQEVPDSLSFIRYIRQKSMEIQAKTLTFA